MPDADEPNPDVSMTSREQILRLLRRAPHSVNDLAAALGVTDNAVRANLARLERDGMIHLVGRRPGFRKPEAIYDITLKAEHSFGAAYVPLLESLLRVLESGGSEEDLERTLKQVGRQLAAPHLPAMRDLDPETRAARTLEILQQLGGMGEVRPSESGTMIVGFGCPLSEIVSQHPKLCLVVEALVSELLGQAVHEQCNRGKRSRCCFSLDPA
jgi:predicted ArsR family transcriptional regulator